MRKILLMTLLLIVAGGNAMGQETRTRGTYLNLNYVSSTMKFEGNSSKLKSDYGAALTIGHTFNLHKKPILGLIRIGIDCTYFDLNFAKSSYDTEGYSDGSGWEAENVNVYKAEVGMQVGPSIKITPVKGLSASVYYRYAPSYSGYYDDEVEEFKGGYGSYSVLGLSVAYKVIAIGVENRWGTTKLNIDSEDSDGKTVTNKMKLKTSGPRLYVGFRF
ncbi:MAG: hypothetical protein LBN24_07675 [Mediterranea sp.]|jgi:hypothetical protein|nr:hypothetical protein [Mediterranea sp.]